MEGEDAEAIKQGTDTLAQASHKLAEQLYQQQSQQQPGGADAADAAAGSAGDGAKKDGDDVVDADFTEVKK
jgi:molecular chaperone DnaK